MNFGLGLVVYDLRGSLVGTRKKAMNVGRNQTSQKQFLFVLFVFGLCRGTNHKGSGKTGMRFKTMGKRFRLGKAQAITPPPVYLNPPSLRAESLHEDSRRPRTWSTLSRRGVGRLTSSNDLCNLSDLCSSRTSGPPPPCLILLYRFRSHSRWGPSSVD